jgi:L-alanine-DL-glutamate epimerase-like enolase superfamily enzyme
MPGRLTIETHEEIWSLKQPFRISRGARAEARVVVVTVSDGRHSGRGEGVPLSRYDQNIASVLTQIESVKTNRNFSRQSLQDLLPAGAARNALDCALWDLEAKVSGKRVWELPGFPLMRFCRRSVGDVSVARTRSALQSEAATNDGGDLEQVETSFTISLDTPEKMGTAASANASLPILKLKLGGDDLDLSRVQAVRETAPAVRLLIDANESWSPEHYSTIVPSLKQLGVELIEQPFPAHADEVLETLDHPIPVCADESCHTTADLARLMNRYEAVNVKLDKTGGLTEALSVCERARETEFKLLIGCMVCTSLGIAPARLLASFANWIDLDGPLLLARDRDYPVPYVNGRIGIPPRDLWG